MPFLPGCGIRDVGMMEFNLCEVPVRSEGDGYNGLLLLLPEIPLLHNLTLFFEMEVFAHNISIEKGKFTPFLFLHEFQESQELLTN